MSIRCVVVTPERTELDRVVDSIVLPMYDGELGIKRGRAAMIGRLGYGQMRLQTDSGTETFFIDGGFAQVEKDVVSVLTSRALPGKSLNVGTAETELSTALSSPASTPQQQQIKAAAVMRARGLLRTAARES
jgi:F-type H+-transporting ATPase subunit epsilon